MGIIKKGISIAGKAAAAAASKVVSDKVGTFIQDEFGTTEKKSAAKKEAKTKTKNTNLIKCPDCGELVSIHATTCPHCGCPIEKQIDDVKEKTIIINSDVEETKETVPVKKESKARKPKKLYPKEVKFVEDKNSLWTTFGFIAAFGAIMSFVGIMCYTTGDSAKGYLVASISIIAAILMFFLVCLFATRGDIKSFYIDENRIDIFDGLRKKIAVNNNIVYKGSADCYEFQLQTGAFVKVEFNGANSTAVKIENN